MSWSCDPAIEAALWDASGAEALGRARLRDAIRLRSRLYTSEREHIADPPEPHADRVARAVFFTVADVPKIAVPLAELARRGLLPETARILDLGAGCGAMTWGLSQHMGAKALDVMAVDRDRAALDIMNRVGAKLGVKLRSEVADLESLRHHDRYDLVVLGSALNELGAPQAVIDLALSCIGDDGSVIVIEPALRDTARRLHQQRDRIVESGAAHVFAPCVRTLAPCPALADERDWCHEDRPTDLPPRTASLAAATGLRQHGMKFSYLVLRKQPDHQTELVPAGRVVSRVRKLKGKWEAFVCSDRGRRRITLLKRDRTPGNQVFCRAERGDVLAPVGDDRIDAGTALERLSIAPSDS